MSVPFRNPRSVAGLETTALAVSWGAVKRIVYGVIESTIESFLNIRFSGRRDYRISVASLMVIENKKPEQFHSVSLRHCVEQVAPASKARLIFVLLKTANGSRHR
jgi:hypothetical protein